MTEETKSPQPYSFTTREGHTYSGIDKQLHSIDDQPAVVYADGTRWWYRDGKIHRDNGPAIIHANGVQEWWQNNQRQCIEYPDSLAVHPDLRGVKQFYENGVVVREEYPPALSAYHAERADLLTELRRKHGLPT